MRQRSSIAIGLAALLLAAVAATGAPPQALAATPAAGGDDKDSSGIGIRLLDIPASTQADPRARAYIVDNLQPGATIQRRVQVENDSDTLQTVAVYAASARISGDSFVGDTGATANELTRWISAAQPELSLAPHATADDVITLAVPATATEGERYAAIWAQVGSSGPSAGTGGSHAQITSVSRVGIRVYLSVGPGNGPQPAFSIASLTARRDSRGRPEVLAAVQNTGARAVDLSGTLSLSGGTAGLSAGPFSTAGVVTLAPGAAGNVTVPLSASLPRGPWDAKLTLTSGLVSQSIAARIAFPAAGHSETVTSPKGPAGWQILWIVVGVVAILVIAALLSVWAIRARRRVRL